MAVFICTLAVLLVAVSAAPPAPPRFFQGGPGSQLDYYLDNVEMANYYTQAQQKQVNPNAPARLESLEPDSEVELVPGVQQPQQPPQQTPLSPNLPGLVPGQRVFIVHMPVAGYRPGTIGGYQPVYIVSAAGQGNNVGPYAVNGVQNAILLDPSGQGVQLAGINGYFGAGLGPQQPNPGLLQGVQGPLGPQRPFDLAYQDPNLAYQQFGPQQLGQPIRLAPVPLRQPAQPAANEAPNANQSAAPSEQKRVGQSSESNELKEEPRRNPRPAPAHASRKP